MTRAVVISGSRRVEHRPPADYNDLFDAYLAPFLDDARVLVGGARGIDTLALNWLLSNTTAPVCVAVPSAVAAQPPEARDTILAARRHGERVDVVELQHPEFPDAAAYHFRNRWMVDRGTMVVAFPYGEDPTRGTWYTVNYAAELGMPRLIVPI